MVCQWIFLHEKITVIIHGNNTLPQILNIAFTQMLKAYVTMMQHWSSTMHTTNMMTFYDFSISYGQLR